jgi:hypothetical protein
MDYRISRLYSECLTHWQAEKSQHKMTLFFTIVSAMETAGLCQDHSSCRPCSLRTFKYQHGHKCELMLHHWLQYHQNPGISHYLHTCFCMLTQVHVPIDRNTMAKLASGIAVIYPCLWDCRENPRVCAEGGHCCDLSMSMRLQRKL